MFAPAPKVKGASSSNVVNEETLTCWCVCVCVCVCVSSPLDTDLFSFVEEGKKSIINDGVGALLRH